MKEKVIVVVRIGDKVKVKKLDYDVELLDRVTISDVMSDEAVSGDE